MNCVNFFIWSIGCDSSNQIKVTNTNVITTLKNTILNNRDPNDIKNTLKSLINNNSNISTDLQQFLVSKGLPSDSKNIANSINNVIDNVFNSSLFQKAKNLPVTDIDTYVKNILDNITSSLINNETTRNIFNAVIDYAKQGLSKILTPIKTIAISIIFLLSIIILAIIGIIAFLVYYVGFHKK